VFVRNAARELIAEVSKPAGRKVELAVEPGEYELRLERQKASMSARTRVADGGTVTLEPRQFGPAALEPTRSRGNVVAAPALAVAGRHRIEVLMGRANVPDELPQLTSPPASSGFRGLQYTGYVREDLAVTVGMTNRSGGTASVSSIGSIAQASSRTERIVSVPVGLRWSPFTLHHPASQAKPFVAATIGPVFGAGGQSTVILDPVTGLPTGASSSTMRNVATVGGDAMGGVDVHVLRWFSVGVSGGYNWMADFSRPIGEQDNYSGPRFTVSFGFLFGKGR